MGAKISNEEIIKMYKILYVELGKTPSQADVRKAHEIGKICDISTIYKKFGGIKKLQESLDLELSSSRKRTNQYTKDVLLEKLSKVYKDYEGNLSAYEFRKLEGFPRLFYMYSILEVHSYGEMWKLVKDYMDR